jgi:adenosylcobinamide kinase/adenosylcobinamide-phosphate guanylyltransferase
MIYFLSGGAKNGKSSLAQRIAKSREPFGPIYYLATMIPRDREDEARIEKHVADRAGWGFETVECGTHILSALDRADPRGFFLVDSVTALLSNEMFRADGTMDEAAPERVERELAEFSARAGGAVFVSDFLYADAAKYDAWTEAYRAGLARADRRLAGLADAAAEVCAGMVLWYKGGWDG